MKIGFDYRPALRPNSARRGIGSYVSQLARALVSSSVSENLVFYGQQGRRPDFLQGSAWKDLPYLPRPSRLNWLVDVWLLPGRVGRDNLDIFHANDPASLPKSSGAQIWATIHDMIPYIFWEEIRPGLPADFAFALQRAFRLIPDLDGIITDSSHSRDDICEMTGIDSGRVHVIYPGPGAELKPVDAQTAAWQIEQHYGIEGSFLFYVGGSDFRKNLPRLIEAFRYLSEKGYEGRLVLGGETFVTRIPEVVSLRRQVDQAGLQSRVLTPGFIPAHHLAAFYSCCDLFVFPSLYEGFGLPVLEAMRCGAPVAASRVSSIPEVAGPHAFYLEDPTSVEEIGQTLERGLSDQESRERFQREGPARAARFTWQDAARRLAELYRGAI